MLALAGAALGSSRPGAPRPSSVLPPGDVVVGRASVIDGDTLEVRGVRIRLFGVDAPESSQRCKNGAGMSYRCGQEAARALKAMVRNNTVRCDRRDVDIYGRIIGVCTVNGSELNAELVDAGLAVAYRQYSAAYVANESRATRGKKGLWAGSFEMPWSYRQGRS